MIARRIARIALAIVSLAAPVVAAGAQNIPVVNGSFEANVLADGQARTNMTDGWNMFVGQAGTFNPNNNSYAAAAIPGGSQLGFANAGGSMTQTFATLVAPNTLYTLTYFVGNRADMGFNGYLVSLLGGSTVLASQGNLTPGDGQFLQGTLSFATGASGPGIGQALGIRLAATASTTESQANFDLVALSASTTVPEPATVALLAAGMLVMGGVAARRKRAAR
jgi:hypothetical protein